MGINMKTCSKCKLEKQLLDFSKNVKSKDGYQPMCKICVGKYKKIYRELNKDKIRDKKKLDRQLNKEKYCEKDKVYRELNKDKIKLYREENKDYFSNYNKLYREKHLDRLKENRKNHYTLNKLRYSKIKRVLDRIYRVNNRAKCNANGAKRRASKLKATPRWLTVENFQEIKELYEIAQAFKLYTGQEYHVDHIVPLQGENVCGLHVPWNLQIILASENIRKSNKLSN